MTQAPFLSPLLTCFYGKNTRSNRFSRLAQNRRIPQAVKALGMQVHGIIPKTL